MAKLTNAKTIMENATGNVLFISVHSFSRTFQVGVKILKDSTEGKNVTQSLVAYNNYAMSRGIQNITAYLERRCRYKDLFGRYVIDEAFVNEFVQILEGYNNEVKAEAEAFVSDYDGKRAEIESLIMDVCVANKRKRMANGIIKKAMMGFPTKAQILAGHISYTMDTDGTEAYEGLKQATKNLVDESRIRLNEYNRCHHLASRCNPVLESLFKFSKQIVDNGKIHGSTIASYLDAVDGLMIANKAEFANPLPDITDFLNHSNKVIDDPESFVDAMIMGFGRFYATQGMLDYIPYEIGSSAGYNRDVMEDVGRDPQNSFSILFASVGETTTAQQTMPFAV